MAYLGQNFNATTVAPAEARELLPAGKYPVQIIESEMKDTQSNGRMLKLTMEILDGPHKGRRAWDQLNLVNKSAQAVEIAQRSLSAICHAVGVLHVNDSEALHLKPMMATVAVEPDNRDKHLPPGDPTRRMQNTVKGYAGLTSAAVAPRYTPPTPPPAAQPPAEQPPAATRPAAAAPWQRRA